MNGFVSPAFIKYVCERGDREYPDGKPVAVTLYVLFGISVADNVPVTGFRLSVSGSLTAVITAFAVFVLSFSFVNVSVTPS